ncbi:hypothetical protein L486_03709 [Kwoniella mangroviensis CBS 10435]|uniref:N-acetyltransferase domain-containing protein n=1 Tax=Kwoniella mangroviensis CBS 10435 TaxID=1331196 RepID=A0A1B9IUL9_9TREE|nr:hypothetical protein L486_03709 [Kwoniella mangroviensis CBS 10435]OCF76540.1 hypothetical protein I204_02237 [Kwoniella mangroviensis CBS 8886]
MRIRLNQNIPHFIPPIARLTRFFHKHGVSSLAGPIVPGPVDPLKYENNDLTTHHDSSTYRATHADITPPGTSTSTSTSTPTSNKLEWTIRQGTSEDASAISQLMIETFSRSFGHSCTPDELEKYCQTTLSIEGIKKDLENPLCTWLLAVPQSSSHELLGIAQLTRESFESCLTLPKPIELQRIYLSYAAHGTGLATDLITTAEDKARQMGFESIWLGAWEDNRRAKRFYNKMGFREVGEHVFDIGGSKQRDEIMEKLL